MRADIAAIMHHHHEMMHFSGVCLVKQGDQVLFHEACGLAHRGFGIPNSITTRFDTASITKLFTAVAIVQLIERNLVALGTAVMPFLGIAGTAISDDVTILHLLTHTSGIADDADEEAGEDYELLFVDKPNYSIRQAKDFLPQFAYKPPVFAPGEGVRYNNCAFVLLGLVIEKVTGVDYRTYVEEHIFARARMIDSGFCAMDEANRDLAEGYKAIEQDDGSVVWKKNIYSYPPIGSPDGGATVTALDLDRFLRAILDGTLVSAAARELLLSPHILVDETDGIRSMNGFAFEFRVGSAGEIVSIQKDGQNAGVAAQLVYYPATDTSCIILANQDCNVWSIQRELRPLLMSGAEA